MVRTPTRRETFLGLYVLTVVVWLSLFPVQPTELEVDDVLFSGLALGFAGGSALLVFRLELPALEVGWGVFTYSQLVRFLDAAAEGPEVFESLGPGTIMLAGLGIILLGFARTTDRLRLSLSERSERLAVLNRVLRHNLSNDLTSIIGALQYFQEHADGGEDEALARMAVEQAWTLSELSEKLRRIDDILERAERRGTHPRDPTAVAEAAVESVRADHPEVTFEVVSETDARMQSTDGVETAVVDVVENACEHNDAADPVVEVVVAADGADGVTITVADNGPGIPEHELVPIRQGEETALSHGSSVGLWFVTWVVELSGGDVSFEYDGGQRVVMRFPRAGEASGRFGGLGDHLDDVAG